MTAASSWSAVGDSEGANSCVLKYRVMESITAWDRVNRTYHFRGPAKPVATSGTRKSTKKPSAAATRLSEPFDQYETWPGTKTIHLTSELPAVVQVGRADQQAIGIDEVEERAQVGAWIREMLDDLARDDDPEPPRRREIGVDELGVVPQLHHIGDGDMADVGQGRDVQVVEAPAGAVDEDLEPIAPEDVGGHLRHVELPPGTVGAAGPRGVGHLVDALERAVIERVLGIADEAAHPTHEHVERLRGTTCAHARRCPVGR